MKRGQATREKIERASMALFLEKGVNGTSVRDIAEACGIAEGTLYRHFHSKEEMIREIFTEHYVAFSQRLSGAAAAVPGLEGKVACLVALFCGLYDEDPILFGFLLMVQHRQIERLPAELPNAIDVVHDLLAADPRVVEPMAATASLFGILVHNAMFVRHGRIPAPLSGAAPQLTRQVMAAVTA
ncbi:MAG: TetR/AcrR family transcriptional regulator [Tistlia sp.]|uniref:TetR/AcrR family transcriptional regulator n=1 Tax=Tistlia sp. TaxID=3057121 RepID=UPI0034A0E906